MDRHKDSVLKRMEIVETGRRRRWSEASKRRIVLANLSSPRSISATAREHGISRSLLLKWRRQFAAMGGDGSVRPSPMPAPAFVPAVMVADTATPEPAAPVTPPITPPSPSPRTKIVLRSGHRINVEGSLDVDAVLKLAQGLETLS